MVDYFGGKQAVFSIIYAIQILDVYCHGRIKQQKSNCVFEFKPSWADGLKALQARTGCGLRRRRVSTWPHKSQLAQTFAGFHAIASH